MLERFINQSSFAGGGSLRRSGSTGSGRDGAERVHLAMTVEAVVLDGATAVVRDRAGAGRGVHAARWARSFVGGLLEQRSDAGGAHVRMEAAHEGDNAGDVGRCHRRALLVAPAAAGPDRRV